MHVLITLLLVISSASSMTTLSGQVVDNAGTPMADARVFLEPELSSPLIEFRTDQNGHYEFHDVAPGTVGVFAFTEGLAFGGSTVQIAIADTEKNVDITLKPSDKIEGTITDFKGKPVTDAQVTRIALLGADKVGIPLAKLTLFGFEPVVSDQRGRFMTPNVPAGSTCALKIGHPRYAQGAVSDVKAGNQDIRITLYEGVLVDGQVRSQDQALPVINASLIFRNVRPPYDTAITKTDGTGHFAIQLQPGDYLYQAAGVAQRSPGWIKLMVSGQSPVQTVELWVKGKGSIQGRVADARTGDPITGAKLYLENNGELAAITRTGPTGEYRFETTAGDNYVELDFVPGYLLPEAPALRIQVAEGSATELPTFWLVPIPKRSIRIVDSNGRPVTRAVAHLVWPYQLGWQLANEDGVVDIKLAYATGSEPVIGIAEHLDEPLGALFKLNASSSNPTDVQLQPLGAVRGRVVDTQGNGIEDAYVSIEQVVNDENSKTNPVMLSRTTAKTDSFVDWNYIVPNQSYQCSAFIDKEIKSESMPFTLEPQGTTDIGNIVITSSSPLGSGKNVNTQRKSVDGNVFKWYDNELLCGPTPTKEFRAGKSAVIMICDPQSANECLDALTNAKNIIHNDRILFVLLVNPFEEYACRDAQIPVLKLDKAPPGHLSTYLLDPDSRVILETNGLPPLREIQALIKIGK